MKRVKLELSDTQTRVCIILMTLIVLIWGLKYHWLKFTLQTDVFLNIYLHANAELMINGWDPYVLGYTRWYPILGAGLPLNWLGHALIKFLGDSEPIDVVTVLRLQAEFLFWLQLLSFYTLFRFLGRSRWAATVGSIVVNCTGFLMHSAFRELNIFYQISFIAIPWVMMGLCLTLRHRSLCLLVFTGGVIGLSLLGGSNSPLFLGYPLLVLVYLWNPRQGCNHWREALTSLAALSVSSGLGILLAAAQIVPSWHYLSSTVRAQFIESNLVTLDNFWFLLSRVFFNAYTPVTDPEVKFFDPNFCFFVGLPVLCLAAHGVYATSWRNRAKTSMLCIGILPLIPIFIFVFPPFMEELFRSVMRLLSLRFNERFFLWSLIAVGYFCACSVDLFSLRGHQRFTPSVNKFWREPFFIGGQKLLNKRWHVIYLGLALLWGLYQISLISFNENRDWQYALILTAILGLALVWVWLRGKSKKYSSLGLCLLLSAYFLAAQPNEPYYGNVIQGSLAEQIDKYFKQPSREMQQVLEQVLEQEGMAAVATNENGRAANFKEPFRIARLMENFRSNLWSPRWGIEFAFEPHDDPATPKLLEPFEKMMFHLDENNHLQIQFHENIINLFNIKYLYLKDGYNGNALLPTSHPHYFKNPRVFPRYYLTHLIKTAADDKQLLSIFEQTHSEVLKQTTLLLNEDFTSLRQQTLQRNSKIPEAEFITIQERSPTHLKLLVGLQKDGLLNASELWFPAWKVHVNGIQAEIKRANQAFWAVGLGQGTHEVTFDFVDDYAILGRTIGLVSWVMCVLYGMLILVIHLSSKQPRQ